MLGDFLGEFKKGKICYRLDAAQVEIILFGFLKNYNMQEKNQGS